MSAHLGMRRGLSVIFALACALGGALGVVGTAAATPSAIDLTAFDCTGPAGTPTTFEFVKQDLHGSALLIVGTNQVFTRQGTFFPSLNAGAPPPQGLVTSGFMVTCSLYNPFLNNILEYIYGKITPVT